jgi:type VI secretion system protein ImpC
VAGISVRSGVMVFGNNEVSTERSGSDASALKVLVLGDFAGAAPRAQPLEHRKHLRIDADTFDDVFSRLGVAVKLPFDEQAVRFSCLQDMHPDHLYDNISLFNRYRAIKKQLQSPSQFSAAVTLLSSEGLIEHSAENLHEQPSATTQPDLLDEILSGNVSSRAGGIADQLIRQTVAPYLQPKEHPKVPEYLAAVDEAMGEVMRKIMHSYAFQKLESGWRGLDLLQRRLDLDRSCQLWLLDAASAELQPDREGFAGDFSATDLGRNISAQTGKASYDVIVFDENLSAEAAGLQKLEMLLAVAEQTGALVLAGGDDHFATWIAATDQWQELRQHSAADRVFVSCPRVLLRLPYGKRTAVIDSFAFEELPLQGAHDYYLWGNGAYLLLMALVQAERRPVGACHIENLPLHVYRDEDGDEAIKPCAEFYLAEKQVGELESLGLTVLQSMHNSNTVMIQRWRSLKPAN